MNTKLLESINSSRHSGTFSQVLNEEDERALILLMANLDTDDMIHLMKLDPTIHDNSCECEVHQLFGRMRQKEQKPKSRKRKIKELENPRKLNTFVRFDAYGSSLRDNTDPARHLEAVDAPWLRMHPELRQGECFLGNIEVSTFDVITWKSKRLGEVACSENGTKLKGLYRPLFVSMQEVLEAGLPAELFTEEKW